MKLKDVVEFQNGYAFKSKDFIENGEYKVIKIKELKDGEIKFFDDTATVNNTFDNFMNFIVRRGDIIFALTGDPVTKPNPLSWVGRVSFYTHDDKAVLNQRVCKLLPSNEVNPKYIYYYFREFSNFYALASIAKGSASQANISTKDIGEVEIDFPSLDTQNKVVSYLDALDRKIALNTEINNNLEQQAQLIFRKQLLSHTELPDGWTKASLIDIADYLNGLAMQKYRPTGTEEGIPVIKIKELRQGFCDDASEFCSPNIKQEYLVNNGDVIFSWSGSLLVDFWCGGLCGLNQHLFKVTSTKYDKWFYYSWTNHHLNRFIAIAADKATTMGHIKRDDLAKSEVYIPSDDEYMQIGELLQPIYDKIISNRIENTQLAGLRDTLLPKLMSGELDVSGVDI